VEVARFNVLCVRKYDALRAEHQELVLKTEQTRRSALQAQALGRRIAELRNAVELNYTAVYKLAQKHDKWTHLSHLAAIMAAVDAQPFMAAMQASGAFNLGAPAEDDSPLGDIIGIARGQADSGTSVVPAFHRRSTTAVQHSYSEPAIPTHDMHIGLASSASFTLAPSHDTVHSLRRTKSLGDCGIARQDYT